MSASHSTRLIVITAASVILFPATLPAATLALDNCCDRGGPIQVDTTDPLHAYKADIDNATDETTRGESLRSLENLLASGVLAAPALQDGLNFVGHQYYRHGAFKDAVRVFEQLADIDQGDQALDALRMLGQIHYLIEGNRGAGESAYLRVTQRAGTSPMADALRQDALSKLASIYSATDRHSLAMATRLQAMDLARKFGDDSETASAALEMARDAAALGLDADATHWYDAASDTYRGTGDLEAMIVVEMEAAAGLPQDAAIQRLAHVWQHPHPELTAYFVASHTLAGLLFDSGAEDGALDVLRSLEQTLRERTPASGADADTLGFIHQDVLATLIVESERLGDAAARDAYLARFLSDFPNSPHQELLGRTYPELPGLKPDR